MEHEHKTEKTGLAGTVLARIEREKVVPRPRLTFLLRDSVVWGLWGLSVAVGAAAVAAALFAFANAGFSYHAATHDSLFEFLVDVLPWVWLLALAAFVALSYYNFRHTRRGYRHSLLAVLGGSVAASVLLGGVLYATGLGETFEERLGRHLPFGQPVFMRQQAFWNNPERGLLAGEVVRVDVAQGEFTLAVFNDGEWVVRTEDLHEPDLKALASFPRVRVAGVLVEEKVFHGCMVFPWREDEESGIVRPTPPPPERTIADVRSTLCKDVRPYRALIKLRN